MNEPNQTDNPEPSTSSENKGVSNVDIHEQGPREYRDDSSDSTIEREPPKERRRTQTTRSVDERNPSRRSKAKRDWMQKGSDKENGRPKKKSDNRYKRPKSKDKKLRDHQALRVKEPLGEPKDELILGALPDFEAIQNLESIENLAGEIASTTNEPLDFTSIYESPLLDLIEQAKNLGIVTESAPTQNDLIDQILKNACEAKRPIIVKGILEVFEKGYGLIVYQVDSYRYKAKSAFVPAPLIRHYGLKRGHIVEAQLHPNRQEESCPFAVKILSVMGNPPEEIIKIRPFTELTPYYPLERIRLETDGETNWDNFSMRVVDLLTPIGFGQRGLIVAPPRTGKTMLLQGIANSIQTNNPDVHLIVLLVDERPEEVTDFRRQIQGEVISSTFDEPAESHCRAAEMVIEKSRRMTESGQHVVILLDSITRLARAYNTMSPNSGKILSGGVEANALQKPKRFFGSARNIEGGGSLTILATALVETGSRMDEVIFEEFKGTGNMELHLDRSLVEKRIFPALSMDKSGTRKEELLYHPDEMEKIYSLRRAMKGIPPNEAMQMLLERVKKTKTNVEFLMTLNR